MHFLPGELIIVIMKYAKIIVSLTLFLLLYFPLFPRLAAEWSSNADYSHGFLIPILCGYFIWRKKDELKKTALYPSAAGIIIVFSGLLLYILGKIGYQDFLQYFSMLIVLFGLVYAIAGQGVAKITFFPISYLIFMIPLPQLVYTNVTFRLRILSTELAYFFIKLLGINAAREGNIITLPTCTLIIATPCSGIRGLIVFMAASLAIGYLFQKGLAKRLGLFIFSIILALLMNTLRLTLTAFTANLLKLPQVPASLHDGFGYAVMVLGLVILFGVNNLLNRGAQ